MQIYHAFFYFLVFQWMWRCKVCGTSVSRRSEHLINIISLNTYVMDATIPNSYACIYFNCPCTCKTWKTLLSHLSRSHQPSSQTELTTFKCLLCNCNQCSTLKDYFQHIAQHLKNSETVDCVFQGCSHKTKNLETPDKLENERLSLLSEVKKQHNCSGKGQNGQDFFTAKTGHCGKGIRSGRVVVKLKNSDTTQLYLHLQFFYFYFYDQFWKIKAEFIRITTVPLQTWFLASLNKHHNKLIEIRNKGGVVREKTWNILNVLNQVCTCSIHQHLLLISHK